MFEGTTWALALTMMVLNAAGADTPAMSIQIEGFKTEASCMKAAEKAKKDIRAQVIEHFRKFDGGSGRAEEIGQKAYLPIVICVKKN